MTWQLRGKFLISQPSARDSTHVLWQHACADSYAMTAHAKPFVVTRNKWIAPKERRIERLPSGYAVREFYDNPRGHYWYVITALEVVTANKKRQIKQGA